jgi:hypothetical protein
MRELLPPPQGLLPPPEDLLPPPEDSDVEFQETTGRMLSPLWMSVACGTMVAAGIAIAGVSILSGPAAETAPVEASLASDPVEHETTKSVQVAAQPQAKPSAPVHGSVSPATKWVKTFTVSASDESVETISARPAPLADIPRKDEGPATVASIEGAQQDEPAPAEPAPLPIAAASAPRSLSLEVPASVRIRDSDAFEIGGVTYKLTTLDGLGVQRCDRKANPRCENHPRADLKKAIAGATLSCEATEETSSLQRVTCTKTAAARAEVAPVRPVRHRVRAAERSAPAAAKAPAAQAEFVRTPPRVKAKRTPLRTLF